MPTNIYIRVEIAKLMTLDFKLCLGLIRWTSAAILTLFCQLLMRICMLRTNRCVNEDQARKSSRVADVDTADPAPPGVPAGRITVYTKICLPGIPERL